LGIIVSRNRAVRLLNPCGRSDEAVQSVSSNRAVPSLQIVRLSPQTVHLWELSKESCLLKPCTRGGDIMAGIGPGKEAECLSWGQLAQYSGILAFSLWLSCWFVNELWV